MQWFLFERAVLEYAKYFTKNPNKKPFFFHWIRCGTFLWNLWYSEEIQIAALLHDAIEDTDFPPKKIETLFGTRILEIIKANSKNPNLPKEKNLEDIVKRCSECGLDAMIVKIADVYDNFLFYKKEKNISEIMRCKALANLIILYKKEYNDPIFTHLNTIIDF